MSLRHKVTYWSVTPSTARALHAVVYTAEALAAGAVAAITVMAGIGAWRLAVVSPPPLLAIAASAAAGSLARLAFETARACRALRRWHQWPHRQINDRTGPPQLRSTPQ